MNLATRLERLGSETAFAVSLEAAAFAASGGRVFPFHLGDMNIPTPRNIMDATYKGHAGWQDRLLLELWHHAAAQEVIAADINKLRGTH